MISCTESYHRSIVFNTCSFTLNVTPRTLERYVKAEYLKRYRRKIGREVFYKRSEVEDLLRIYPVDDEKAK